MKDAKFVRIDEDGRHVYQLPGEIHRVDITIDISDNPEMVEIKTSSAIGAAIDWLVGKIEAVEGLDFQVVQSVKYAVCRKFEFSRVYAPSTSWEDCGPLIEKYGICVLKYMEAVCDADKPWTATMRDDDNYVDDCESPLIAACRAIVAAKLGDTVSVPKELMQ